MTLVRSLVRKYSELWLFFLSKTRDSLKRDHLQRTKKYLNSAKKILWLDFLIFLAKYIGFFFRLFRICSVIAWDQFFQLKSDNLPQTIDNSY